MRCLAACERSIMLASSSSELRCLSASLTLASVTVASIHFGPVRSSTLACTRLHVALSNSLVMLPVLSCSSATRRAICEPHAPSTRTELSSSPLGFHSTSMLWICTSSEQARAYLSLLRQLIAPLSPCESSCMNISNAFHIFKMLRSIMLSLRISSHHLARTSTCRSLACSAYSYASSSWQFAAFAALAWYCSLSVAVAVYDIRAIEMYLLSSVVDERSPHHWLLGMIAPDGSRSISASLASFIESSTCGLKSETRSAKPSHFEADSTISTSDMYQPTILPVGSS